MGKVPCKDCNVRHSGCHSGCDEYKAWKSADQAWKAERSMDLGVERYKATRAYETNKKMGR